MNVFLSWSGPLSRAIAEAIRDWLKCVLQGANPWLSAVDIDRGALWADRINSQIATTSVGIVCLTAENRMKPWILFEAGALARGLSQNLVCTVLIDLQPADVSAPLSMFQSTRLDRESMRALCITLNRSLVQEQRALDETTLETVFDAHWLAFDNRVKSALAEFPAGAVQPPDDKTLLSEILSEVRATNSRVDRLENRELAKAIVEPLPAWLKAARVNDELVSERVIRPRSKASGANFPGGSGGPTT